MFANFAGEVIPTDCGGVGFTSLGHNLVGLDTGCPVDGSGDQTVDPDTVFTALIGPLQHNGGPTETHALLAGSAAIDAGDPQCSDPQGVPLTTDQRGSPRPVDGNGDGLPVCDIGAVEFQALQHVNAKVTFQPDSSTFMFSRDTSGCPESHVGKFNFKAQLTNTSQSHLSSLAIEIAQLMGGNVLLTEAGLLGEGERFDVPEKGDFLDGRLSPQESVEVPFTVCLKERKPFRLFVDVLGITQ